MTTNGFHLRQIKLAWGLVKHRREKPKPNHFTVGACFVRLVFAPYPDKQAAQSTINLPTYPKIDQRALISVNACNYGFEKHDLKFPELIQNIQTKVEEQLGRLLPGEVHLHTFPKVLGYVFNPVSFWYFHDDQGVCNAVLCEVNNTFGERHFYLLAGLPGQAVDKGGLLHADKAFHVSPFFPVSGRYEFRFMNHNDRTLARINYFEGAEQLLCTSINGELSYPNGALWCKTLLKYGWFTVLVSGRIVWQAAKLYFKGAEYHSKPTPPAHNLTETKIKA